MEIMRHSQILNSCQTQKAYHYVYYIYIIIIMFHTQVPDVKSDSALIVWHAWCGVWFSVIV